MAQVIEVKKTLETIIKKAYNKKTQKEIQNYCKFFLEISDKSIRSYTGKYNPATKVILVIGKKRSFKYILICAIHELSHHIDYINRKSQELEHKNDFYSIYENLIRAVLELKLCSVKDLEMVCDYVDLEHIFPVLNLYKEKNKIEYHGNFIIKVQNAYERRELLSEKGFQWNTEDKTWDIKVDNLDKILKL